MTIGIDASRAFRQSKTGTEWYSWHIIRELAQLIESSGDRLILYSDESPPNEDVPMRLSSAVNMRVLRWPFKHFWTQGRLSLEMFFASPDILFIPAHAIPLVHPKRTVTTIHDVGFLRYPECYSSKDLASLRFSTLYAAKHATRIITISEFSKREIIAEYNIHPSRIDVVGLGCDRQQYRPHDMSEIRSILTKYAISQPYIISIGRIDARKHTSAVIKTFEQIRKKGYPGSLVLVGPEGFGGQDVAAQILNSSARDHIFSLGWIAEQDKILLLCGADAMIFLSRYEGFGLPVIEAQSCGIPVLCSDAGALSEVGGDAAIYCNPDDIEECANKALQVVSNGILRDKIRAAGLVNAERFSWRQAAGRTLAILTDLPPIR